MDENQKSLSDPRHLREIHPTLAISPRAVIKFLMAFI